MADEGNADSGEIIRDRVRYMLVRPDVLMGVAHELRGVSPAVFLAALEESAFRHVQASFLEYQAQRPLEGAEFVSNLCAIAARLGWGVWSVSQGYQGGLVVEVRNSPFAAGFGPSDGPVCAAIVGILRAAAFQVHGVKSRVRELTCAAQGASRCTFEVPLSR